MLEPYPHAQYDPNNNLIVFRNSAVFSSLVELRLHLCIGVFLEILFQVYMSELMPCFYLHNTSP